MKNIGMEHEEHYAAFCDCSAESVLITRFKDDEYKEIYLSIWGYRYPHSVDWQDRLRHIWRIIRIGYPYEDDIVLNPDSAKALGIKLIEYAGDWIEKENG